MSVPEADQPVEVTYELINSDREALIDCGAPGKCPRPARDYLEKMAKPFHMELSFCKNELGHLAIKVTPTRWDLEFMRKFKELIESFITAYKDRMVPTPVATTS